MNRLRLIRRQVVADLKAAAIPGVGDRVFPSRSRKIFPEEGDLLLVYTQDLDADDKDTAPVIYSVDATLVVRVVVQDDEEAEDGDDEEALESRLDELVETVVRVLQPVHEVDGPLGGLVEWLRWKGTRPFLSADGEIPRNTRQILFSAQWSAELPDTIPADDLLRIGTQLEPPAPAQAGDLSVSFTLDMRTP